MNSCRFLQIVSKFKNSLRNRTLPKGIFCRNYATLYTKEFEPLDVFGPQEKVSIKLESPKNALPSIRCEKSGDTITVGCESDQKTVINPIDIKLNIEAPLKSNINVTGDSGGINVGSFYGSYIDVKSGSGDVLLSKSQCDRISAVTKLGNILCNGILQARDINLSTEKTGSITTDRLQGLKLKIKTTSENVSVQSTYCDSTTIETDFGNLQLKNVHKNVTANINYEGLLSINGFDGVLNTKINKGLIEILPSRIQENSLIYMKERGTLILKLSEDCQENTDFVISSCNCIVNPTVESEVSKSNDLLMLHPKNSRKAESTVIVDCKNAQVLVSASSWWETIKSENK